MLHILSNTRVLFILGIIGFFVVSFYLVFTIQPPCDFKTNSTFTIERKATLSGVAEDLKIQSFIRSDFLLKVYITIKPGEKTIKEGEYLFEKKENLFKIAHRITNGYFGIQPIKVTFPEGTTVLEMSKILKNSIPNFDSDKFQIIAKHYEGFLFPDTYKFYSNVTPEIVLETLTKNFDQKVDSLSDDFLLTNRSKQDVIIMASILEEEGNTVESKKMIADILWKRLDKGMLLQVDAPFKYVFGKTSEDLTLDDLKASTTYNTYVYKGLTPTPISNPGVESIKSAIYPIKNDYLYFLSDKSGNMHYAKTHDEHVSNKKKYLK
jgi:UPF0755 protein